MAAAAPSCDDAEYNSVASTGPIGWEEGSSGSQTETLTRFSTGVAISAGAACSSGKVGQSAALAAMGLPTDVARAAIRISLGYQSTAEDVDTFMAVWATLAASKQRAA